jgi:DNA-binding NtrC family response regulator
VKSDTQSRLFAPTNSSIAFWSRDSTGSGRSENGNFSHENRTSNASLIYAVDDMPYLTELYSLVLGAIGHRVRTFQDRHAALAALKVEKPALLITDFCNASMPTERFLRECIALHPKLRILMATGFGRNHAWLSFARPDRFLQKPFTPDELQQAVRDALAGTPAALF